MAENPHAQPSPQGQPQRTLLLITIALGVLLNPLNSSMISVALTRLEHAFHLTFTAASWLISTYYLASAIAQPLLGKVADAFGRKAVFIAGLILVAAACACAPFAPTFAWLIVLRLIQAAGTSALYPAGMGIIRDHVGEGQARALALLSVFASGAAAFGPSIGGLVLHWGDWPAIFWINFPFLAAGLALATFILPRDLRRRTPAREAIRQLDLPGVFWFAFGVVFALVFLLSFTSTPAWWAGGLGAVCLGLFFRREHRAAQPFLDPRLFRQNRPLAWVLLQFLVVNIIFYSVFFGVPSYLQEVRGYDARETGLLMLCIAGFGVLVSPLAGRWIERQGVRPPLLLAALCMTAGSLLFLTEEPATQLAWLILNLCILGVSNGFNNVGLQTALFRVTPRTVIGQASGLFQTARYAGTILSTVLLGVLFGNHLSAAELHRLGMVLAALGLVILWMSWRVPARQERT
ncbi:putative MFS-type transporter YwoD [Alicyclobacillus cellulosilyticus]|uniref:MFS-type transporter YwoD n=1 Tax=Alicyclobacillus cellulosilyticus TaxID=1003997 RepID=A0A917NM93_9BACL|nr:MFS transporter [Alicyclobacillus cellulosilyticus]GGJ11428.1 putative MFS-type transporter YwoD [Alicyclobacillus cellulosilyticus]